MSRPTAPPQNPVLRSWSLRGDFFLSLKQSPTFQEAVRDLKAEWSALIEDQPALSSVLIFQNLPAREHTDDPLNAYIVKVRNTVANTLRCRVDGAPADWVCQALHAQASGKIFIQGGDESYREVITKVRMAVTTVGTGHVSITLNGYLVGDPVRIAEDRPPAAFTSWNELKKAAYEHVDKALEVLKDEMDSITSSWPRPYKRGDKTRKEVTTPKLVAWLVEGEEMVYGDRSATHKLLHELGLDPPGKS